MKKMSLLPLVAIMTFATPFHSALADVQALADKCDACHGEGGNSEDEKVPNIAGMSTVFLGDTLSAYASGDRKGVKYKPKDGEESDMNEIAEKLSEEEISAIAEYYAGKKFAMHVQEVDAELADKGKKKFDKECDKCHSEGGTVADDDASLLLGQWKHYLKEQFSMFGDGSRTMPKKMQKKFDKLDDDDKASILEYLAGGKR
jgi:sulfide dehydrogenase cytochrome subunit